MRIRALVCALALIAVTAGAAPAPAGERFASTVSLNRDPDDTPNYLYGRVRSTKAACARGRKIKVIRRDQGTTSVYGRAQSNRDGLWRLEAQTTVPNGTYRAIARSKRIGAGRCLSARSNSVFLD